jgi:nitrous oxide reductase
MADRIFKFGPEQRLQILNILPQESGSLQESIQIKRLRDEIAFSDEEREKIDMDDRTGSFDPMKLQELEEKEVELCEEKRYILAGSFIKKEDEGEVPTNDTFVELAIELEDEIEDFREDLD